MKAASLAGITGARPEWRQYLQASLSLHCENKQPCRFGQRGDSRLPCLQAQCTFEHLTSTEDPTGTKGGLADLVKNLRLDVLEGLSALGSAYAAVEVTLGEDQCCPSFFCLRARAAVSKAETNRPAQSQKLCMSPLDTLSLRL